MKGLIFILDGLGDRPCASLGGKTPLEAAATPNLDKLAAAGVCGMMDPYAPGVAVDTHTGVGILFGLPPAAALRLRRGPIEAAGLGREFADGDVLLRANFATVEHADGDAAQAQNTARQSANDAANAPNQYRIVDRRAGRIDAESAAELCAALRDMQVAPGVTAKLHPATGHRAVLQLRGANLSAEISDTDPGGQHMARGILPAKPLDAAANAPAARATAAAVNRFTDQAYDALNQHPLNRARVRRGLSPANGILLRSAGLQQSLQSLPRQLGLTTGAVAGEKTILGLARLLQFNIYTDARFTSLPRTDLHMKLQTAATALAKNDLVFVHIKGTDIAAHDRDPQCKADVIHRFDGELGRLLAELSAADEAAPVHMNNLVIGITADHSTDSNSGEHTGDPVPVLIHSRGGRRDRGARYGETDCMHGGLGRITARNFLRLILDAMNVRDRDNL